MFEQCPKQYYFTYLDPIYSKLKNKLKPIPENIWKFQTVGKAVHNAITLFYYLSFGERTCANLLKQLKTTWESKVVRNKKPPLGKWGGFTTVEEERKSYKEAQAMLRNFYKLCDANPGIAFLPAQDLRRSIEDYKNLITQLNDNYDISGKFDLIVKAGDRLHIIDFKTSKKEESDFFQLRFYKVLAEEKFKIPVERVSFYYLRTGIKTDFSLKDMSIQDIKNEILRRIGLIASKTTFPTRPSKLCKYCLFKTFCPKKHKYKLY